MRVNSFSLFVPEGRERDSGHVELRHNTVYSIRLGNHDSNRHCDATVVVDGKEIGSFRVNAGCTAVLERPAHDTGRFTFFEQTSQQAQDAGVQNIVTVDRGLIQVVFRPERPRQHVKRLTSFVPPMFSSAGPTSSSYGGETKTCGGITGLTGQSQQQFHNVPNLDYEPNAEVTISLRLVTGVGVRELTPARGNAVPQPV